jgi:hypothetical protein
LNTYFIALLEVKLDYLSSTRKRANLEILKLDSAQLDYIPVRYIRVKFRIFLLVYQVSIKK